MEIGGVMGYLVAAVVGLLVGAIAKALMPGPDPGGWFMTIILGIVGSWVGNFLFGWLGIRGGLVMSLIAAVVGAMLLLLLYRVIRRRA